MTGSCSQVNSTEYDCTEMLVRPVLEGFKMSKSSSIGTLLGSEGAAAFTFVDGSSCE